MAVNRTTGTTSKVALGEETSAWGTVASSFDKEFGWIQNFKWNSDASMQKLADAGTGGINYAANVDGVEVVSGNLEWGVTDGRELEFLMGAISGSGPYTVTQSYPLPSLSAKAEYNGETLTILGLVFSKWSMQLSKDQWVKCNADWIARAWSYSTATVTPNTPSDDPFMFLDGYVTFGGTAVASLSDITIECDMKTEMQRGIENVTSDERRLATGYVSKLQDISLNMTAEIINQVELNKYLGGTSIQDERADATVVLNLTLGSRIIVITLTGVRLGNLGGELPADGEVRTLDMSGSALGISASITTE